MLSLVGHQNSGPVTVIKDQDSKNVKATITALSKIMFWWEIWTDKQCYNFKITIITSWSVSSEIHYSEILTISPTFPSTSCQGIFRLLYQDGQETVEKKERLLLLSLLFDLPTRLQRRENERCGEEQITAVISTDQMEKREGESTSKSPSPSRWEGVRRWVCNLGETELRGLDRGTARKGGGPAQESWNTTRIQLLAAEWKPKPAQQLRRWSSSDCWLRTPPSIATCKWP